MSKKIPIIAVITGDIINSRKDKNSAWLKKLKKTLSQEGKNPATWEIYRGDSFQLGIKNPADAFLAAIRIKANIKSIKKLDVRMAIGIGEQSYVGPRISESNGQAFIYSGEKLETLKKEKRNLAIKTPWPDFDKEMNLYFRLALMAMDNWSPNSAELISILINDRDIKQKTLAKRLGVTQPSVSERQNRSNFSEIMELEDLYREKVTNLMALK
jgi:hypothetical protein